MQDFIGDVELDDRLYNRKAKMTGRNGRDAARMLCTGGTAQAALTTSEVFGGESTRR